MFLAGDKMHFVGTNFSVIIAAPQETHMGFKPGQEELKVNAHGLALQIGRILDSSPRYVEDFRALAVASTFFIRAASVNSNKTIVTPAFVISGLRTSRAKGDGALQEVRFFMLYLKSKLRKAFELEKDIEILLIESCGEAVDLRFDASPEA